MRTHPFAARGCAAALLAVVVAGCDATGTPSLPVTPARYTATGGAVVEVREGSIVVVAPIGGGLAVRADVPTADLLFRPPTLSTGGVFEAVLEPEVVLETEREVVPRIVWRSEREPDGGGYTLSVSAEGGRLARVEGVRPDGGVVAVPATTLPCGADCGAGQTEDSVGSIHYTRVCDYSGCTIITTYDFVGGGKGEQVGTRWMPPGEREAVPVTEVRFVVEGGRVLDTLRRLRIGGFEELEVVQDRFGLLAE
jgi:hypothetical protein